MPNAPLPKPAAPVPKAAQAPLATPQSSMPSQPASVPPGATPPLVPPQSQIKVGAPPVTSRINQPLSANRPITGASSNPSAPVAPPSTSTTTVRTTPNRPPIQVARPGSPLPMQPAQPQLGSYQSKAIPTGAPVPATPVQQPPRTLSALQSMSSTNLPASDGKTDAPQTAPGKSNLSPGYGIPQTPPGGAPPPPSGVKKPQFAEPKKSPLRFLPFILGGLVVLGILGYVGYMFLGGGTSSITDRETPAPGGQPTNTTPASPTTVLEYWGLWEPTETMTEVIKEYEAQNPGVSINYTKQSHTDYRVRLNTALVQGQNGPDIFRYHASWVPMLKDELSVLPSGVMTSTEYQTAFYPSASEMLNVEGNIVGIPLMYEGLALYYNTEIFSTAVLEPPKTWPDLRTVASRLTVKADNNITRAGVAMGNAKNVEHFSDILAVLMMQNKADLLNPNSAETRDALKFYVNFVTADEVWNDTLPLSSVAFARGDVAMIFAPSWRALEIKEMNPNLPFKVVPLPQLDDTRTTYASFWAEGVSEKSSNKEAAWKFLKYLSSAEVQKKLHANQSEVRPFGELYSRKDLANDLASDPVAAAYLQDAPYAKGAYMSSYTHDDGLNDQVVKYYEDAVNSLIAGENIDTVLITLDQGVKQVLRQYGVESSTTTN